MCMEDERIGRRKTSKITIVVLPDGAVAPLVGESRDRVSITFSTNRTYAVIGFGDAPNVNGDGIMLSAQEPIFRADIKELGNCVTFPWSAIAFGGTANITVIETFLKEQ